MNGRAAVAGSTPGRPGYRGRSGNLTAAGRRARLLREVGEAAWTARDLFPDLRLDASGRRNPRRSRAALVAEIARLAAEGSTQKEIAVILGISHSYVRDLRSDPDGSKQRERKDSYRGVCQECGASTDGSNGPGNAPELCSTCSRAKQHETRYWTQETVIAAFVAFHERFGRSPTAQEAMNMPPSMTGKASPERLAELEEVHRVLHAGELRLPAPGIVQAEFEGGWKAALQASGLPPNPLRSSRRGWRRT